MSARTKNGLSLIGWGRSDTGRKRGHNEDNFLVDNDHRLFAVADGMGGHRGGATASRMAMEILGAQVGEAAADMVKAAAALDPSPILWAFADTDVRLKAELDTLPVSAEAKRKASAPSVHMAAALDVALEPTVEFAAPPAVTVMMAAAERASDNIYNAALTDPNLHGMGTTLTAMLYYAGSMYLIHAGDSRAYLFRDGTLEQLTEDHTWIAEQLKAGVMTEEEAKTSKYRHVITRSVGFEPTVELDSLGIEVQPGDCFLLCSDGVSNHIENAEIESLMKRTWYRHMPEALIDMANERGGDDNITAVAVYAGNQADQS